MADFLRISPWQANDVRAALCARQVAWLIAEAECLGVPKIIYTHIDASRRLIKCVRRQGWHVTYGLKCNRRLNGTHIDKHAQVLKHRRYTRGRVTTADGDKKTYYVRRLDGRLAQVPYNVRVYFSKRHPREKSPAYIARTDLARSAKQALPGYTWRWLCETVNLLLKTQIGWKNFRVRSHEAVDKFVVAHLAWAYVEYRFAHERSAQIRTHGDIIRQHQDEHAIA
jgi:hypothetical protein